MNTAANNLATGFRLRQQWRSISALHCSVKANWLSSPAAGTCSAEARPGNVRQANPVVRLSVLSSPSWHLICVAVLLVHSGYGHWNLSKKTDQR